MCGGARTPRRRTGPEPGLSPRVRGSLLGMDKPYSNHRSIPACAGEPHARRARGHGRGVYPRVCGGACSMGERSWRWTGLSPRVRGSQSGDGVGRTISGSIPACAGEPSPPVGRRPADAVYPRVCGGAGDPHESKIGIIGLSPRVRGSPQIQAPSLDESRSIPACAGEPTLGLPQSRFRAVYPRVCGGALSHKSCKLCTRGLSPRVRGSQQQAHGVPCCKRSIPACAGEPGSSARTVIPMEVYPRVCGGAACPQPAD